MRGLDPKKKMKCCIATCGRTAKHRIYLQTHPKGKPMCTCCYRAYWMGRKSKIDKKKKLTF